MLQPCKLCDRICACKLRQAVVVGVVAESFYDVGKQKQCLVLISVDLSPFNTLIGYSALSKSYPTNMANIQIIPLGV